jgi:hypothetical protein
MPASLDTDTNTNTDTIVDRAHHNDHTNVASSESTPQLSNHCSPLRPNSTSHLGRRIQHPSLAPRKPNAASRQDSVTPESPSPKVPSESSPEVAHVLLSKDTSHQHYYPVASGVPHDYHHSTPQRSFSRSDQPPPKPANRTRRKPMPSHPRELSISAPTASSLLKPAARSRRRAASNRSAEQPNPPTVASGQPPISSACVMPPPSLSDRNGPAAAGPSSYRELPTLPSSRLVSNAERIMPPSFATHEDAKARLPVSVVSNGHAKQAANEGSVSDAPSLRANQSPSPADADPSSPENETAADRGLRCRVCSVVYGPFSLETAHEEWRTTQNQSQASLSEMIREFPTVKRLHYDNWIQQHQHDPALNKGNVAVRQPYANTHDNTLHSNKRKRPVDEDHPPNSRPTHYATRDSSYDFPNLPVSALPFILMKPGVSLFGIQKVSLASLVSMGCQESHTHLPQKTIQTYGVSLIRTKRVCMARPE